MQVSSDPTWFVSSVNCRFHANGSLTALANLRIFASVSGSSATRKLRNFQTKRKATAGSPLRFAPVEMTVCIEGERLGLLAAEDGHGLDAADAANGEVAGGGGDDGERGADEDEGCGIGWPGFVEDAGEQAREAEGCGDSETDAEGGEDHTATEHEVDDAGALGSESHANADFAGALLDVVGDDSVDSDDGEKDGDGGEGCHDLRGEASPRC